MRVDICATPQFVTDTFIHSRTVIVIDVLRATTSIIQALRNGAERVIPAADPGAAVAIAGNLDKRNTLLAGESGGIKLPGFDLGNSPGEFNDDTVKGKVILFSTTNGTRAMQQVAGARTVLVGAMSNCAAAAKAAYEIGDDIAIVCAGTNNDFSCDDVICAGAILSAILECDPKIGYNDLGHTAMRLYQDWKKGEFRLEGTTHYSRLKSLGFDEDLKFCFEQDTIQIVPKFENGVIGV